MSTRPDIDKIIHLAAGMRTDLKIDKNRNTIVSIFYSRKFHKEGGHRCYYTNECTYISVLILIKCTSTLYIDTSHIYLTYIHIL